MGFLSEGKEVEQRFVQDFLNAFSSVKSSDVIMATKYEDMYKHIDVKIVINGDVYSYDVKGQKKVNRSDENYDSSICWLEFINVKQDYGWMYGKANYIAFEQSDSWLIVDREELLKFIKTKIDDFTIYYHTKRLYKFYSREKLYNKPDLMTLAKLEDVRKINKTFEIPKQGLYE